GEFFWFFIFDLSLFYFHAHAVLAWTEVKRKRYAFLPLLLFLEWALYVLLKTEGVQQIRAFGSPFFTLPRELGVLAGWRGMYILGLSTGYWFVLRTFRALRKNNRLLEEQIEINQQRYQYERAF